jgi:hypothetical protein
MAEQEWLTCLKPQERLDNLPEGKASERKLRLFAVAAWRHLWPRIWNAELQNSRDARKNLELAERLADSQLTVWVGEVIQRAPASSGSIFDHSFLSASGRTVASFVCFLGAGLVSQVRKQEAEFVGGDSALWCRDPETQNTLELERRAVDSELLLILQDVFGNPFRPVPFDPGWRTPNVTAVAQAIYEERRFDELPVLADALEEAGCTSADLLSHCRSGGEHARGCWAVDLVLGKS